MPVTVITAENFDSEVLQAVQPVLVDFWAEWCGPCRMTAPIVEQVAEERPHVKVCKINIDEQPELAARYQVMSIPTLMLFTNGEAVKTAVGPRTKPFILGMLE